jgi:hypothetical protein
MLALMPHMLLVLILLLVLAPMQPKYSNALLS